MRNATFGLILGMNSFRRLELLLLQFGICFHDTETIASQGSHTRNLSAKFNFTCLKSRLEKSFIGAWNVSVGHKLYTFLARNSLKFNSSQIAFNNFL